MTEKEKSLLYGVYGRRHKDLDPNLFDLKTKQMLPEVRVKIMKNIGEVINPDTISGLFLIGSSCGHTWSSDGDLDITVVTN